MRKHSNNPFTILGTKKQKTPKRFRKNHRFTNARHFINDGWSGTSFERPSFTEMMDLVGGNIDKGTKPELKQSRQHIDRDTEEKPAPLAWG